jgi:hypothetical protein
MQPAQQQIWMQIMSMRKPHGCSEHVRAHMHADLRVLQMTMRGQRQAAAAAAVIAARKVTNMTLMKMTLTTMTATQAGTARVRRAAVVAARGGAAGPGAKECCVRSSGRRWMGRLLATKSAHTHTGEGKQQ